MKKRTFTILLIITFNSLLIGQFSISDSIQLSQDKTLKSICREVSNVGNQISKIDSNRFAKPIFNSRSFDSTIVTLDSISLNAVKTEKSFLDMLYNSFGDLISAFIGALIAFFVFYCGWKKEKEKKEKEEAQRIIEKNKYLKSILKKSIRLSERYEESINNFREAIKNDPYNIPEIELYPLQEFGRLQDIISNEEYFHAFLKKYDDTEEVISKYGTIASISDYLDSQAKEFLKTDYRLYDHDRKTKYSNFLREVHEDVTELGMNNRITLPHLDQNLQIILNSYGRSKAVAHPSDLEVPQNQLVEPLTDLFLDDQFFRMSEVRMILNKLSRMRDLYIEIPMQNMYTANRFKLFQDTMSKTVEKLKEETEHIVNESSD